MPRPLGRADPLEVVSDRFTAESTARVQSIRVSAIRSGSLRLVGVANMLKSAPARLPAHTRSLTDYSAASEVTLLPRLLPSGRRYMPIAQDAIYIRHLLHLLEDLLPQSVRLGVYKPRDFLATRRCLAFRASLHRLV